MPVDLICLSQVILNANLQKDSPAALSGDIAVAYLDNESDTERHFDAIRRWLQECRDNHPRCNQTVAADVKIDDDSGTPLPSRLIDVSHLDPTMVVLRESDLHMRGSYLTLSHRWGNNAGSSIVMTTTANLDRHKQGILVSNLPKTFQDTIKTARSLEIPYVWIDSLCIIQDDSADWEREASQMARIYQFSIATIADTGASDSS